MHHFGLTRYIREVGDRASQYRLDPGIPAIPKSSLDCERTYVREASS